MTMFPEPRIIFRSAVYGTLAAALGVVYWVHPTQMLYVALLAVGYLSLHSLLAKTLALWTDRLYYATLGRQEASALLQKFARKAAVRDDHVRDRHARQWRQRFALTLRNHLHVDMPYALCRADMYLADFSDAIRQSPVSCALIAADLMFEEDQGG